MFTAQARFGLRLRIHGLVGLLAAAAVLPVVALPSAAQSADGVSLQRLWGQDRFETSVAVARRFVAESGGVIDSAVLVSGASWHDAVVASGLAGSLGAPVLLTQEDGLPGATASFLAESGVSQMVVVGDADAVSDQVFDALGEFGAVERVSGADPSSASVAVAQRMGTPGVMPGHGHTVVVASAEVFADAMVAGGFSARGEHPVLLTAGDALDASVRSYVADSGAEHAVVMGGTAAVSHAVQDDLEALGVSVTRLGGKTRLHTAVAVAEFLQRKYSNVTGERCFDRLTVGLATAWVPFDAFSAGPLLGELCAPLLLTDPAAMDPEVANWINARTSDLIVFGGRAAVSANALAAVSGGAAVEGFMVETAIRRRTAVADLAAKIDAGAYGVGADNVLRGPDGFEIDLDECPPHWSDSGGVTADEIRIGHTTALTGDLSDNRRASEGLESYLEWVNENDPIVVDGAPRELVLLTRDDRTRATQPRRSRPWSSFWGRTMRSRSSRWAR